MNNKLKNNKKMEERKEEKMSYDQLKNIAVQLDDQVRMLQKQLYEEKGKLNRVNLILECLRLEKEFSEVGYSLFEPEKRGSMADELYNMLYPPVKEEVPLVPTEAVN